MGRFFWTKGTKRSGAFIKSINIGSMEEPVYLKEKEALKWLIDRNSCKGE